MRLGKRKDQNSAIPEFQLKGASPTDAPDLGRGHCRRHVPDLDTGIFQFLEWLPDLRVEVPKGRAVQVASAAVVITD